MANRKLDKAHQEIEAVRSRLFLNRWDTMTYDVERRLVEIKKLIDTTSGNEIHRHVIVASIAALQTYHRGTIVSIVDSGDDYKVRAAEHIPDKITIKEALSWLGGTAVTFGELVAHTAPCNSVADLISWLSALLASDIKQLLTEAIDPYDRRNHAKTPTPVIADVDCLLKDLTEAFRLRHIFAHEAAPSVTVSAAECACLLSAVRKWINGVEAVLWATVYRDKPLTQFEMGQHARAEVLKVRKQLAQEMRKALAAARSAGTASWLRRNHSAWMKATVGWTQGTYWSLQGTMWPAVGGCDLAKAIQVRADQVADWNRSQNPERKGSGSN